MNLVSGPDQRGHVAWEARTLFELLADHTDLLQGLFSFLLRLER